MRNFAHGGDELTGVILAGGKSRRMGYNKALLRVGGKTIIERVLEALKEITDSLLIITNSPEEYDFLNIPMKGDILPGKGAFGGVYTALSLSDAFYSLVVACDMPFLNSGFLRYMTQFKEGYDIVIPKPGQWYEPLCAIYAKTCIPQIENLLGAGCLKIIELFPMVRTRYVGEEEIKLYNSSEMLFFNVNTQEDYLRAQQKTEGRGKEGVDEKGDTDTTVFVST